jgi:hypothetical protein
VGVVGNARTARLRGGVEPRYFVAAMQLPASANTPTLLIRTATDTEPVMKAVRNTIARVDAGLLRVS